MVKLTLPDLLARCAAKFPGKEAIVSEEGRWTFAEWNSNANRRACALAGLGIGKGDHVATLFLNGRDVLETYLALMKLGAVPVPLNARLSPRELAYIVDHSQAASLIFGPQFRNVSEQLAREVSGVRRWIACGGGDGEQTDLNRLLADYPADEPDAAVDENDLACILYTAGTTGRPKGVMLSHGNCLWASVNLAQDSEFDSSFRVLLVFPLYHAAAFSLMTTCLYLGCTLIAMSEFNPQKVMEVMVREKVSKMAFPPTVWNFILQLPGLEQYDTSSVESVSSGAEAMPLETKRKLLQLFPKAKLGETYGMTETAAAITTLKPRYVLAKTACVGQPFTNVEIRLTDARDQDVPLGEVGEILVRGPNVTNGYFRDENETARAIKDGWLRTGDLGRLDRDGFLYLVDRKKDMIISGGENIYPREIEEVLYTHPAVSEAAVIGLPDPVWGEKIHAVVSLKPGSSLTAADLIEFCKQYLAGYKKIRSLEFVDKLPRSPAGKVLKRLLKGTENTG